MKRVPIQPMVHDEGSAARIGAAKTRRQPAPLDWRNPLNRGFGSIAELTTVVRQGSHDMHPEPLEQPGIPNAQSSSSRSHPLLRTTRASGVPYRPSWPALLLDATDSAGGKRSKHAASISKSIKRRRDTWAAVRISECRASCVRHMSFDRPTSASGVRLRRRVVAVY